MWLLSHTHKGKPDPPVLQTKYIEGPIDTHSPGFYPYSHHKVVSSFTMCMPKTDRGQREGEEEGRKSCDEVSQVQEAP